MEANGTISVDKKDNRRHKGRQYGVKDGEKMKKTMAMAKQQDGARVEHAQQSDNGKRETTSLMESWMGKNQLTEVARNGEQAT